MAVTLCSKIYQKKLQQQKSDIDSFQTLDGIIYLHAHR